MTNEEIWGSNGTHIKPSLFTQQPTFQPIPQADIRQSAPVLQLSQIAQTEYCHCYFVSAVHSSTLGLMICKPLDKHRLTSEAFTL